MWHRTLSPAKAMNLLPGVYSTIVFLLAIVSIHSVAMGQFKSGTIELNPVYVGEEFSFPLSPLFRGGGKKTFALSKDVPHGLQIVERPVQNQDGTTQNAVFLSGEPDTPN